VLSSCYTYVYYCVILDLFRTEQEGEYVHDVNAMLDDDMGVHVTDDVIDDVNNNGNDSEVELDDDADGNNSSSKKPKDEQGSSGEDYLRSVLLRLIYRCVTVRHTTTDAPILDSSAFDKVFSCSDCSRAVV
jgi:hypothetical protein